MSGTFSSDALLRTISHSTFVAYDGTSSENTGYLPFMTVDTCSSLH